jgi:hypothetical protein
VERCLGEKYGGVEWSSAFDVLSGGGEERERGGRRASIGCELGIRANRE